MGSPGPVDVHVDFAELGRVHTELQNLHGHVAALGDRSAPADAAYIGGAIPADAVNAFLSAWFQESQWLSQHLRDCHAYVEAALGTYTGTERALSGATASAEETL